MKWYSTIVYAIGIAFSAAIALYPKTAPAQEVQTGKRLFCDTAEQVARVIKADDFYASFTTVNNEKANSCAVMEIAFIAHGKGEVVRIHGEGWQVTQIVVIAVNTPQGWGTVEPMIQWTVLHVAERSA